jgi:hypothetical protein
MLYNCKTIGGENVHRCKEKGGVVSALFMPIDRLVCECLMPVIVCRYCGGL